MANDTVIPKGALPLVFAMLGFSLVVVTVGVLMPERTPADPLAGQETLAVLTFADRADGGIAITANGEETILAPDTGGFIRGVARALARERLVHETGPAAPFHLTRDARGNLAVVDPEVGTRVSLRAFGEDNALAFAALIPSAPTSSRE